MTNFAAKHSIMTPEMVEIFCNDYLHSDKVHPRGPSGREIHYHDNFPKGKVVYIPIFKLYVVIGIPFNGNLMAVLRYFYIHISQLSPFGAARVSHFEVKLLESTSHCFMPLVTPAAVGSSSAAALQVSAPEVPAPAEVDPENVVLEDAFLDLTGPDEVVATQPGKSKRKRLGKQSDTLPAKQLRKDHPSFATGTGGKTFVGLRQLMPTSSRPSFQDDIQTHVVQSARITDDPVYTAAATVTSARENVGITPTSDVAGSSQLETSEGSDDSFYELSALNSAKAKRCMDYEQLYTKFNVGAALQICLESEVRSRAEHELELKEKLKGKYDAHGRLFEERDLEILRLKSLLAEETERVERAETAEVVRFHDQVSILTAEVSALKITIAQKDTDISLLDSRATHLKSVLDDFQAACAKAGGLITSLTSERDRLSSEVSTLHAAFQDFKEKAEAQQEEQAQVLYNRVAELEYQGILGHALGRAMDFGMKEGLEAGHDHGVVRTPLSAVEAYNPEVARTSYFDAVRALEDVVFPLVNLLKSKKDAGMDEVLDCFILDGPLADLPEAANLQPCLEQLFIPIHHSADKAIVRETFLSFALLNVHPRAERAKKHAAALRQLMMEIVSNPLSSQTWVGETSTSAAPLSVEDFDEEDTDEALGSVVAIPKFEACRF
ncbi:hypothetical protein Tco_0097070 [Tanacetum coccineum]